jgi:AmmeMemoRadiSam system protein B
MGGMSVRRRSLPPGWYPGTGEQVERQIAAFLAASPPVPSPPPMAPSGVAPHAGWAFSGAIAAQVVASLDHEAQTVVVVGGHLGRHDRALAAREEGYETPLGTLPADMALLEALSAATHLEVDEEADNTVEVQLPLVRHFYPGSMALALRAPPRLDSFDLGRIIARVALEMGRRVVLLGSTDLTHYGPAYGYTPRGTGRRALQWVRDENDARMIRAMEALDPAAVVAAATEARSACSAGGALAAMGFSAERGAKGGVLLRYATSHDVHPDESFVGYAGVVFPVSP